MTQITNREIEFPKNRDALIERAIAEPDGCISVGGLANELRLLRGTSASTPRVLGKLIEVARRRHGWSAEQLANEASVELADVVNIETNRDFVPQPRTIVQLAGRLGFSVQRLMELAGLSTARGEPLNEAALLFAARSEPASQLTTEERDAYDQFVIVLVETTGGG